MPTSRPNHRAEREAFERALEHDGGLRLRLNPEGRFEPVVDDAKAAAAPPPTLPGPQPAADPTVRDLPDHQREIEALKASPLERPSQLQPHAQPGLLHRLGLRRRAEPELDAFGRPVRRSAAPPRSSP